MECFVFGNFVLLLSLLCLCFGKVFCNFVIKFSCYCVIVIVNSVVVVFYFVYLMYIKCGLEGFMFGRVFYFNWFDDKGFFFVFG